MTFPQQWAVPDLAVPDLAGGSLPAPGAIRARREYVLSTFHVPATSPFRLYFCLAVYKIDEEIETQGGAVVQLGLGQEDGEVL